MGYYVEMFGKCAPFILQVERLIPYVTMVAITLIVCLTLIYIVRKQKSWNGNA